MQNNKTVPASCEYSAVDPTAATLAMGPTYPNMKTKKMATIITLYTCALTYCQDKSDIVSISLISCQINVYYVHAGNIRSIDIAYMSQREVNIQFCHEDAFGLPSFYWSVATTNG